MRHPTSFINSLLKVSQNTHFLYWNENSQNGIPGTPNFDVEFPLVGDRRLGDCVGIRGGSGTKPIGCVLMSYLSEITPGAEYRVARQATGTPTMEALFKQWHKHETLNNVFCYLGRGICGGGSLRRKHLRRHLGEGIWEETLEEKHLGGVWEGSEKLCGGSGRSSGVSFRGSGGTGSSRRVWDSLSS